MSQESKNYTPAPEPAPMPLHFVRKKSRIVPEKLKELAQKLPIKSAEIIIYSQDRDGLVEQNPALAILLIEHCEKLRGAQNNYTDFAIKQSLKLPQAKVVKMIKMLGAQDKEYGAKSIAKILAKVPIEHCTKEVLVGLIQGLKNKEIRKLLAHVSTIKPPKIKLLQLPIEMLSVERLERCTSEDYVQKMFRWAKLYLKLSSGLIPQKHNVFPMTKKGLAKAANKLTQVLIATGQLSLRKWHHGPDTPPDHLKIEGINMVNELVHYYLDFLDRNILEIVEGELVIFFKMDGTNYIVLGAETDFKTKKLKDRKYRLLLIDTQYPMLESERIKLINDLRSKGVDVEGGAA